MDRNMGTVDDMRKFVDAAHAKGIRVVMDVVLNHPGYHTIKDMHEYGFGEWQDGPAPINWKPDEEAGENWHSYHEQFMDYNSGAENWAKWWGPDWIRAGLPGYEAGGQDDLTQNLSYLPDFKTDEDKAVALPPLLVTKWKKEKGGDFNKYLVPAAASLRQNMKAPPAGYLIKWLAAWVEEFGIDGFRCDTAKHVDIERWKELKVAASAALEKWRAKNPGKPGADWKEPFWMTGEVWGQGVVKNDYYDNGFDSIINFSFVETLNRGSGPNDPAVLEKIYSSYAKAIVGAKGFNVLTYISSHDTILFDRKNLIPAGTALLLCPGAVQIYYGDESARPDGEEMSDIMQQTRSDMNWKTADKKVFEHFRKLNQFRLRNVAVAAGKHNKIKSSAGYAFSRVAGDNRIAAVIGAAGETEITVGDLWKDGVVVANAYDGKTATVAGGKVKFAAGANGVILVEAK
jgi:alpha-amylase